MKLSDFIDSVQGKYKVKLQSDETLMSRFFFWAKYHDGPEWDRLIDSVWTMQICGETVFMVNLRAA